MRANKVSVTLIKESATSVCRLNYYSCAMTKIKSNPVLAQLDKGIFAPSKHSRLHPQV